MVPSGDPKSVRDRARHAWHHHHNGTTDSGVTHRSGDASASGLATERRLAPAPTEPSAHARILAHACMRVRARHDQTRAREPSASRGSIGCASAALTIGGSGCSHYWRAWIVWHLAGLLTTTRSSLSRWALARLRRSGAFGRRGRRRVEPVQRSPCDDRSVRMVQRRGAKPAGTDGR